MQISDWWRKIFSECMQKSLLFCAAAASAVASAQDQAQATVEQLPAFGDVKWKFFDVNWDAPMNTVSGITEWSRDINSVYLTTTVITGFVFFAVSIPLIFTLIKFRHRANDTTPL